MSPFAEIKTFAKAESTTKRTEFLKLEGPTNVRILDRHPYRAEMHYFAHTKTSIECIGDECPVCEVNRKIYSTNPEDFRSDPNYHTRSIRYFVNVLDKTISKICPKCGEVVRGNVPACSKCGEMLLNVVASPLNQVKVLGKGVQLFEQLNAIEASVLGTDGAPLGLTEYDLTLVPSGSGAKSVVTAIPDKSANTKVEINVDDLFDLTKAVIRLERDEMIDVMKGISLKDVFTARKAVKSDPAPEPVEDGADARKIVDDLFASLES